MEAMAAFGQKPNQFARFKLGQADRAIRTGIAQVQTGRVDSCGGQMPDCSLESFGRVGPGARATEDPVDDEVESDRAEGGGEEDADDHDYGKITVLTK
ncbi:hypothetical protein MA16_Dca023504 [Dendrobium catenatum]|uniref:Uncharacterized protein n=1 Tax=Dendrobium catenatum TaxID=906689 RepID=A0A2I0WQI6_9ASPA|nr:hypothetical protein MA16_Dca023504 [Dendrobium catenatum]